MFNELIIQFVGATLEERRSNDGAKVVQKIYICKFFAHFLYSYVFSLRVVAFLPLNSSGEGRRSPGRVGVRGCARTEVRMRPQPHGTPEGRRDGPAAATGLRAQGGGTGAGLTGGRRR